MRYGFFLFVLLTLGCKEGIHDRGNDLGFLPDDITFILSIKDAASLSESIKGNDFLSHMEKSDPYGQIEKNIGSLASMPVEGRFHLVFYNREDGTLGNFAYGEKSLLTTVSDSLGIEGVVNTELMQKGITPFVHGADTLYRAFTDHKCIVGPSAEVLMDILSPKSKRTDRALLRLLNLGRDSDENALIVNWSSTQPIFKTFLKDTSTVRTADFASWALLDISPKSEKLQLGGVVLGKDSTSFVNLFRGTHPLPHKIGDFAPAQVESILSYTFDDYPSFEKNRTDFLGLTTQVDSLFNTTEEVGILTFDGQQSVMVQTYGPAMLSDFIKSRQKQSSHYQGHEIIDFGNGDFLIQGLSPLIPDGEYRYGSILDNTFVFSETEEAQKKVISSHSNGNNFGKSTIYQSLMAELATESTLLYIANAKGLNNMLSGHVGKELQRDFEQGDLKTYAYGAQLISDDHFFHCHILAKRTDPGPGKEATVPLFNVQLEHPVQTLPQFVINHATKGKEIVVQDQSNILYLISSKGKVLWKKQLNSPIQGRIQQVDLYKNGKLQLAFTTNEQFLILDRNGREVEPFNMEFEGGNLNGLAVFDYDKRKNYRFVVTQGEKVFMYNVKGEIVKGFTYVRTESPILRPPKHFRIGSKDYLVFQLEDGSLKIVNRVGHVRIKVPQKIDFSDNEVYLLNNKFTLTDQKGILYQISANGKINTADAKLFKDHGVYTTSKTLVTMSDNILSIKGKKIELELGVYSKPHIFYIYDKIYVAVTDIQNQKVYLFDSQAKSIPHFPIYGTSAADLSDVDNDRRLELVTVTADNEVQVYQF